MKLSEYSLAATDDLIEFFGVQRSRSHQAVEVAAASTSTMGRRSPSELMMGCSRVCFTSLGWRHLVNAYAVKAG